MSNKPYWIPMMQIPQSEIKNHTLWWLDMNNRSDDSRSANFKLMKKMSGYTFDNNKTLWSNIYGHFFSILVNNYHDEWHISIWDAGGSTSICDITQEMVDKETDILSDVNYKTLCKFSEQYSRGITPCSRCGKSLKKEEIAGRYFAGVYCTECWEGEMKEIEAKETYN